MMSMADPVAIGVEILNIDSCCSLEKEFTELIHINPGMILYLTINQVDSCQNCVYDLLTWDTKYTFWMDDRVLIMTYKSLATISLKCHTLVTSWSPRRWLCSQDEIFYPRYLLRLTQGMRCNEIVGQVVEISKDFLIISSTHQY